MKEQFLSIKQFAKMAKVSPQSIYKRLNQVDNSLNNYVKTVESKKMIDCRALYDIYGIKIEQPSQPEVEQGEQQKQPVNDVTNQLIEMLRNELEAKNKQLAEMQKLLDQEQQLRMVEHQKLLSLKEENKTPEESHKKHWWKFLSKH